MVVEQLMTPEPFVVQVTETVGAVLQKLLEADVRHLPVVDGQKLVGIVSDRDLQRALYVTTGPSRGSVEELSEVPISALMSSDLITVHPEDDIVEVIDSMLEHKVGALPVVAADSSLVVGIVSYLDVLRAARRAFA
jgi:acetoin utilization protein AcuB